MTPAERRALRAAERALAVGLANCGDDPDSLWAKPLAQVRRVLQPKAKVKGRLTKDAKLLVRLRAAYATLAEMGPHHWAESDEGWAAVEAILGLLYTDSQRR